MAKVMQATSTQTKTAPKAAQKASANPAKAESKANLSKVFGVPKK